jgi:ribosomal protein S18 acetylase RimI-like enzyme
MTAADVAAVTAVHLASFPGFFLSFLGPAFLRQLYRGIVDDDSGIALVTERDGRVAGFVAGTAQPPGFYKRLLRRRGWRFALAALLPALRGPRVIPRLLRAFVMPSASAAYGEGTALLMSIAVAPELQSSGAGKALTEGFAAEARTRGSVRVVLTTDRDGNDAVNDFYQRRGFVLSRTFTTPEGRAMNEYSLELGAS